MEKLLNYFKEIYKDEKIEKQYLVFQDATGKFFHYKISNDVVDQGESSSNSSFPKFKKACSYYNEKQGVLSYVVHNHPSGTPKPSLMDFQNAKLLRSRAAVTGLPLNDYMIFSENGYFSFAEAKEWEKPIRRQAGRTFTTPLKLDEFNFSSLRKKKDIINNIMADNAEIVLIEDKLYYSSCLPLENLKKEVENEGVRIIFFFKHRPDEDETVQLVKRFLRPTTIVEVLPGGQWEIIL
ncbi:JAB domain-containing protein [Priestia aryabhattai]